MPIQIADEVKVVYVGIRLSREFSDFLGAIFLFVWFQVELGIRRMSGKGSLLLVSVSLCRAPSS